MKNNDSILSKKDFELFSILNDSEKLEFLYRKELMYQCSINPRMKGIKKERTNQILSNTETLSDKPIPKVNIILIDKYVIISSNKKSAAKVATLKMIEDGFVLQKTSVNNKYLNKNFNLNYKFNACYIMVAVDAPLCYN